MDFNKLREKKKTHWTVWVTLNDYNETVEVEYIKIPEELTSLKNREEIENSYLNRKYGINGWLAYNSE